MTIKNQQQVDALLAQGWTWDADQEMNKGQLNHPTNDVDWYDAETDTFHQV